MGIRFSPHGRLKMVRNKIKNFPELIISQCRFYISILLALSSLDGAKNNLAIAICYNNQEYSFCKCQLARICVFTITLPPLIFSSISSSEFGIFTLTNSTSLNPFNLGLHLLTPDGQYSFFSEN
jgi:hypothetical protein